MTYGMLAAKSCLLTNIEDQLHEDSKKVNSVERLTRHLNKGVPLPILKSYLTAISRWGPDEPVSIFSRWRIEEYFRCKKQMFPFENFRVRKLTAINALNFYITLCMAFQAHISMKSETNALKVSILQKADPVKEKVHFCYYRLAKGTSILPLPV